jgi:uncharacterized protein (DUF1501 family)
MHAKHHGATRRELLLGSGALFAWAFVPKIARAEGRDPRFLTIVLRGALDGLATVAPVGDPDWIKLRGDNAYDLTARRRRCPSTVSSRSTMPCRTSTGFIGAVRPSWCTLSPRRAASARISTARTCCKLGTRKLDARIAAGSIGRWPAWNPMRRPVREPIGDVPTPSAQLRRWSCGAQRRCCRGRRRACRQ